MNNSLVQPHRRQIEELMRCCDQLETHLAIAQSACTHLLNAALNQLINGACSPANFFPSHER